MALFGLTLLLPVAAAQGGNGEVKVWVELDQDTVEIPTTFDMVELPLRIRAVGYNFTCPRESYQIATLKLDEPPPLPQWANYSFHPNATMWFRMFGEYRFVHPGQELELLGEKTMRIRWHEALTPVNATWVYKLNTGSPFDNDPNCYFNPALKAQGPFRLRAYLQGGTPPPPTTTSPRYTGPPNATTAATDTPTPAADGGAPAPDLSVLLWVGAAALYWAHRRRR